MPLIETLAGRGARRVPCWMMRQAGRYLPEYRAVRADIPDFLCFCYTPDATVEAALQPIRRFGFDAAILFSDILVVPDALGQSVRFIEGVGPVLEPLADDRAIARLDPARLEAHLAPVYASVSRLRAALPPEVALIGFAGAPWTLAHYMIEGRGGSDGGRIRAWAYRAPESLARLIGLLADAVAGYLIRQIDCGADAVQLFDSWAGGLAEPLFRTHVIEATRRIVVQIRDRYPQTPVIGFPRGGGVLYRDFAEETGVTAVSLDTAVPLAWAAETLQPRLCVQGNLDNHLLLAGGAALPAAVLSILDRFAAGRHIFNLGHGILPETPPEHVAAVVESVRGWSRR
jgi:uroporphyrinogen decarboxylase